MREVAIEAKQLIDQENSYTSRIDYYDTLISKYDPDTRYDRMKLYRYQTRKNILEYEQYLTLSRYNTYTKLYANNDNYTSEMKSLLKDVIQYRKNVLISGPGGTGKSYITKEIINCLRDLYMLKHTAIRCKRDAEVNVEIGDPELICVCAPTGIAAINIDGLTIHKAFGLSVNGNFVKAARHPCNISVIIIDEISMCGERMFEDILTAVAEYKKEIQFIFIGDFYQLAPPNDTYIINNINYNNLNMITHNFTKVFRQNDTALVQVLNKIRVGIYDNTCKQILSSRSTDTPDERAVCIYATNQQVDAMNKRMLDILPSVLHKYRCNDKMYILKINAEGAIWRIKLPEIMKEYTTHHFWKDCNAKDLIELKVGTKILFNRNMRIPLLDGTLVEVSNGTSGIITFLSTDIIHIKLSNNDIVRTLRQEYMYDVHEYNTYGRRIQSYTLSRVQFPLRLAAALTVNRVQGLTLSHIAIDGSMWRPSQIYVALSRATSLEGIQIFNFNKISLKPNMLIDKFYNVKL